MYHLAKDVGNLRGYACVGVGIHGKPLYINFSVNLKLIKIKSLIFLRYAFLLIGSALL